MLYMDKVKDNAQLVANTIWKYEGEDERTKILNLCAIHGFQKLSGVNPAHKLNGVHIIDENTIREVVVDEYTDVKYTHYQVNNLD